MRSDRRRRTRHSPRREQHCPLVWCNGTGAKIGSPLPGRLLLRYVEGTVAQTHRVRKNSQRDINVNQLKSRDFELAEDPFVLFNAWLDEAIASEPNDPIAMSLATVDASGLPDVRVVLLKGADHKGFVFFTNVESNKARELQATMKAAVLFHWKSLRRQIRIRGPVEHVTDAEADAYFASRPRPSRLGAWASQQSRPLESRAVLEQAFAEAGARFPGPEIPRPPYWSGYRIKPLSIEFWRDGAHRLHDRIQFSRSGIEENWSKQRLYP